MAKVLVADDDPAVRDLVGVLLHSRGHDPLLASDGITALDLWQTQPVDLAILDIGMPHVDGLALMTTLKAAGAGPPVLLLTSRQEPVTRYQAFSKGADDYVCKPFDPLELLLRVEALLKRTRRRPSDGVLQAGPYTLDAGRLEFTGPDRQVSVTRSELAILSYLFSRADNVVSAEELLHDALRYPPGTGAPDTVHTHIRNIRHKVEADPARPRIVASVARLGYRIATRPDAGSM